MPSSVVSRLPSLKSTSSKWVLVQSATTSSLSSVRFLQILLTSWILTVHLVPPLGVFFAAGCGVDFLINILLTILGWLPGVIHAIYIEHTWHKRRSIVQGGGVLTDRAGGIYSDKIQTGGGPMVTAQA